MCIMGEYHTLYGIEQNPLRIKEEKVGFLHSGTKEEQQRFCLMGKKSIGVK